ncbi:MAG: hypothetical protein DRI95_15940 [Bacteroidetes bacterium]|nr:MAG: hypothetical protein DRI95_15940 [Bacteroidota bacterium]
MSIRTNLRKIDFLKNSYRTVRKSFEKSSDYIKTNYYKIIGQPIFYSYYARVNNFGDLFNKDLISFFGYKLIHTDSYKKSQASLLGSILQMYPQDYKGFILGSGFIHKRFKRLNNNWKIRLLRGPLSAEQCEAKNCAYGDPGVLASLVYKNNNKKKYKLGILPHSSDFDEINKIKFGDSIKIITARKSPSEVAKDIMECENIASSSLHGLIFADSYGIPNVHLKFGDKLIGGLHKFNDYYLGMGLSILPEPLTYSSSLNTDEIINACKNYFSEEIIKLKQQEIISIYNEVLKTKSGD